MNLRHKHSEMLMDLKKSSDSRKEKELKILYSELIEAEKKLAEDCTFIGQLSATDGGILLKSDLALEGFGTEILLDKSKRSMVYKINQSIARENEELDSEQFGMRHRSAIRLCANTSDVVVFVISQDGVTNLVWSSDGKVYFKPDIKTTNMNMMLS